MVRMPSRAITTCAGDDTAVVQHGDLLADAHDKVHIVLDEQDYKASQLPYGKQRKLEIARALATNPAY